MQFALLNSVGLVALKMAVTFPGWRASFCAGKFVFRPVAYASVTRVHGSCFDSDRARARHGLVREALMSHPRSRYVSGALSLLAARYISVEATRFFAPSLLFLPDQADRPSEPPGHLGNRCHTVRS